MRKLNKVNIGIIALLLILLVVLQHFIPQPVDWQLNLSSHSKTPYGCYVFRDMLDACNEEYEVSRNFNGFYANPLLNTRENSTLIVIARNFAPDTFELQQIRDFVNRGNTLFVSALSFSTAVQECFNFEVGQSDFPTLPTNLKTEKDSLYLVPGIAADTAYHFQKAPGGKYFTDSDSNTYISLGTDAENRANFLYKALGPGSIYLHSEPLAFTNYHILYSNYEYANRVMALLPKQKIIWDDWYKPGRNINTSPMRYILSEPALRAGYYLILLSLVLYIVFGGKRRQGIIPPYSPPKNTSLNFIRTLGNLYLSNRNHNDLVCKKSSYLWEYIRERYYIRVQENNAHTVGILSQKSGMDQKTIQNLLDQSFQLQQQQTISLKELYAFNKQVEAFYKNCL